MARAAEILRDLNFDSKAIEALANRLARAKEDQYRDTLLGLLRSHGEDRKRVDLSPEIKDALMREAANHAVLIANTHNDRTQGQWRRLTDAGFEDQVIARALEDYAREGQARQAAQIARIELATAKLDAQVQFYRENGVEPQFDLIGRREGACALCIEIQDRSPHTIEQVLKIGYPHLNCYCDWVARDVKREDLLAGGLRTGQITAGRGGVAGIVGGDPLNMRFPSSESAVDALLASG